MPPERPDSNPCLFFAGVPVPAVQTAFRVFPAVSGFASVLFPPWPGHFPLSSVHVQSNGLPVPRWRNGATSIFFRCRFWAISPSCDSVSVHASRTVQDPGEGFRQTGCLIIVTDGSSFPVLFLPVLPQLLYFLSCLIHHGTQLLSVSQLPGNIARSVCT